MSISNTDLFLVNRDNKSYNTTVEDLIENFGYEPLAEIETPTILLPENNAGIEELLHSDQIIGVSTDTYKSLSSPSNFQTIGGNSVTIDEANCKKAFDGNSGTYFICAGGETTIYTFPAPAQETEICYCGRVHDDVITVTIQTDSGDIPLTCFGKFPAGAATTRDYKGLWYVGSGFTEIYSITIVSTATDINPVFNGIQFSDPRDVSDALIFEPVIEFEETTLTLSGVKNLETFRKGFEVTQDDSAATGTITAVGPGNIIKVKDVTGSWSPNTENYVVGPELEYIDGPGDINNITYMYGPEDLSIGQVGRPDNPGKDFNGNCSDRSQIYPGTNQGHKRYQIFIKGFGAQTGRIKVKCAGSGGSQYSFNGMTELLYTNRYAKDEVFQIAGKDVIFLGGDTFDITDLVDGNLWEITCYAAESKISGIHCITVDDVPVRGSEGTFDPLPPMFALPPVGYESIYFESTDFKSIPDNVLFHASSNWEIYEYLDSDHKFLKASSGNDINIGPPPSWTSGKLEPKTKYRARVRYVATNGTTSNWSDDVTFMTDTDDVPPTLPPSDFVVWASGGSILAKVNHSSKFINAASNYHKLFAFDTMGQLQNVDNSGNCTQLGDIAGKMGGVKMLQGLMGYNGAIGITDEKRDLWFFGRTGNFEPDPNNLINHLTGCKISGGDSFSDRVDTCIAWSNETEKVYLGYPNASGQFYFYGTYMDNQGAGWFDYTDLMKTRNIPVYDLNPGVPIRVCTGTGSNYQIIAIFCVLFEDGKLFHNGVEVSYEWQQIFPMGVSTNMMGLTTDNKLYKIDPSRVVTKITGGDDCLSAACGYDGRMVVLKTDGKWYHVTSSVTSTVINTGVEFNDFTTKSLDSWGSSICHMTAPGNLLIPVSNPDII